MEILNDELWGLHLTLIKRSFNDMDECTMIKYTGGIKLRRMANILGDKNKYFKVFYWLQQWAKSNKQIFNLNKENVLPLKKSL